MTFKIVLLRAKRILSIGGFPLFEYSVEDRKGIKQYHDGTVRPSYVCSIFNGRIIAVMGIEVLPKCLFISPLEVLPEYRNRGIGSAIVEVLSLENSKNLMCYCDDDIVGFWKRHGFVDRGITRFGQHRMVRFSWSIKPEGAYE